MTLNKTELTQFANMLDGQMSAFDDMVKAEESNIAIIEASLKEAKARRRKYADDRADAANQLKAVTVLLNDIEDEERLKERQAVYDRINANT